MTVTQKRQTIANNTNSKNAVQPVLFNKLHHEIKKKHLAARYKCQS